MKSLLLIITIAFLTESAIAQKKLSNDDLTIHIKFDGGLGMTQYLNISQKSGKATISSPNFIRMRAKELYKDTDFLNLKKNRLKYAINEFKEKQQRFYDRYSVFDTAVVNVDLKTDPQYKDVLMLIVNTSKAKLEKNHETKDLVMDAGNALFTITTDKGKRYIQAEGLFMQRYPILTNFVNLTYGRLETARQKKISVK